MTTFANKLIVKQAILLAVVPFAAFAEGFYQKGKTGT